MNCLKFGHIAWQLCASSLIAVLLPAILFGQRIEIMDAHTGHHYTLDPNSPFDVQGSASFSPNQKWVAFDGSRTGEPFSKKRLFITKANGSQREPKDLVCGAMPSFSKDGQQIAYSSPDKGGVWVMDVNGENNRQVANGWAIIFSPQDNDVVAYQVNSGGNPNIQIHNLETDETRLLLPDEIVKGYQQIVWNFQWSNDGSQIVFVGRTNNDVRPVGGRRVNANRGFLFVAAMGTGEDPQYQIVTVENSYCRVLFHPDKNQVFYSKHMPSKNANRIFSIDLDVPQKFRVPVYLTIQPDERTNMINDFSSDGNLVAFTSKPLSTESAMDSLSFAKKVVPSLAAVAKLKRAQLDLQQGDYESFTNVLMGKLEKDEKNVVIDEVQDNAMQWLAIINEAISQADKAKTDEDSVVFPIADRPGLQMLQKDGEWILNANQRRIQKAAKNLQFHF